MKIQLPVKDVYITQSFGLNYLDFYRKLGLDGHNGVDFRAFTGCPVYAAHDGIIEKAVNDSGLGNYVSIVSSREGEGVRTRYGHLAEYIVRFGQEVKAGTLIGLADNTGKYTTGSHLHFDLAEIVDGVVINRDNGYNGCIDPAPFFGKNWNKSAAYHRYHREERDWQAEFNMRFKNIWLHKRMKQVWGLTPPPAAEIVNALVYGGWDADTVLNPSMYDIWGWCKKDEYEKGKINFK